MTEGSKAAIERQKRRLKELKEIDEKRADNAKKKRAFWPGFRDKNVEEKGGERAGKS